MSDEEIKKLTEAFMEGLHKPPVWSLSKKRIIPEQLLLLGYDFKVYGQPTDCYEIYPTKRLEFEGHRLPVGTERMRFNLLSEVQAWVDEVAQMRRERAAEKGEVSLYDFMHGSRGASADDGVRKDEKD